MKGFVLCVISIIGVVNCGLLPSIPVDTSIVKSTRIGDSFSYSTIQSRGLAPVVQTIDHTNPIVYTPQQQYLTDRYYNPQLISSQFISPFYPGIIGQDPIYGGSPILGDQIYAPSQILGGQYPILGQYPIFGQNPIIQNPIIQNPIQQQPSQTPSNPSDTVIDEDTVAVDSA